MGKFRSSLDVQAIAFDQFLFCIRVCKSVSDHA